jgi:alkyl hydroperoxide reductase subunit D
MNNQNLNELLEKLNISELNNSSVNILDSSDTRYIKDLKVNLSKTLRSDNLDNKTNVLVALSVAANQKNNYLIKFFESLSKENNATSEEIAEAIACASLLSANNVFYRFRHFMSNQEYNNIPAGVKMNIMLNPVTGKRIFELMSLAISAVNGCEQCVTSHENSLMQLGVSKQEVFEAVRTASIVCSLDKIVY